MGFPWWARLERLKAYDGSWPGKSKSDKTEQIRHGRNDTCKHSEEEEEEECKFTPETEAAYTKYMDCIGNLYKNSTTPYPTHPLCTDLGTYNVFIPHLTNEEK
jgi:hypothetical protein